MSAWLPFAVVACSTVAVGVLSALHQALATVPRASVEELATKAGRPKVRTRLERIFDASEAHSRALGLLKQFFTAAVVLAMVWWVAALRAGEASPGDGWATLAAPGWMELAIGGAGAVVVLWLFAVVVPSAVAQHAGARLVFSRSGLVRGVYMLLSPVRSIGEFVDEVIRRLAGAEKMDADEEVQAELLSVIEEGEATGALEGHEREMLEAVVRFRDLTVAQIMSPRIEIEAMEASNDLGEVIRRVRKLGHSRIPVYEESLDHILGIFYIKDLMHWLGGDAIRAGQKFDLRSLLRPAMFVPENKTVKELLEELIAKKVHIALVADEYGGTAGLVTIEDIVEEIFGDIRDEYEQGPADIPDVVLKMESKAAELDAAARIVDVNDHLERLGVRLPTSEEYDTVGGFVMTTLGRVPGKGEVFDHDNMAFTVLEAKPNRVVKVGLKVREPEAPPTAAGADESDGATATSRAGR